MTKQDFFKQTEAMIRKVFAIRVLELNTANELELAYNKTIKDLPFLPAEIVTKTINVFAYEVCINAGLDKNHLDKVFNA